LFLKRFENLFLGGNHIRIISPSDMDRDGKTGLATAHWRWMMVVTTPNLSDPAWILLCPCEYVTCSGMRRYQPGLNLA
jgi:hypothetical protein